MASVLSITDVVVHPSLSHKNQKQKNPERVKFPFLSKVLEKDVSNGVSGEKSGFKAHNSTE